MKDIASSTFFPWISDSRGCKVPCHKDPQLALWRCSHSKELRSLVSTTVLVVSTPGSCIGCVYPICPVFLEIPEKAGALLLMKYGSMYLKVLVHVIMETEKSPDLSSGSWRPRKASGIVWNPKSPRAYVVDSSPSVQTWNPGAQRAGED